MDITLLLLLDIELKILDSTTNIAQLDAIKLTLESLDIDAMTRKEIVQLRRLYKLIEIQRKKTRNIFN